MNDLITVLLGLLLFAAGNVAIYWIGRNDGRADTEADTQEPPIRLYRPRRTGPRHVPPVVHRQPVDPDATAVLYVVQPEVHDA